MHHLNCLVLESWASALNLHLKDEKILDVFSNHADEIAIQFPNQYLKCVFFKGEMFFFFEEGLASKSRLYKPQFTELINENVIEVVTHPLERSFHILFNRDLKLFFKCHGRKSNLILYSGLENLNHFKRNIETDESVSFDDLLRKFELIYNAEALLNIDSYKVNYPFLPLDLFENLKGLDEQNFIEKVNLYRSFNGFSFSKTDFELFPNEAGNVLEDINNFSGNYLGQKIFSSKKEELLKTIQQGIDGKQKMIHSTQNALEILTNKRPDDEIGNIILANLHMVTKDTPLIEMNDIYNNQNIQISINPDISGVENAEAYFKKEKGRPKQIQVLTQKLEKAVEQLAFLEAKKQNILETTQLKKLKTIEIPQKEKMVVLPYKKFSIDGLDVLVGKNAESNDKILSRYSDKDDTWLHAKDVSGSHVLIKTKKNTTLSISTIEKAASLAAFYSKNRNQSLVTVMYTLRKYVRKIKGADKGKVTVQNEKTVLVHPNKGAE